MTIIAYSLRTPLGMRRIPILELACVEVFFDAKWVCVEVDIPEKERSICNLYIISN